MKALFRLLLLGSCSCLLTWLTLSQTVTTASAAAAAAAANPLGNLFRRRDKKAPPPPPPPPPLTLETVSEKAAHLRDESLKKITQSQRELQAEARRITREINDLARVKGTALRDTALKEAETRRFQVEQEMMRLTQEMEDRTREKATQAEQAAKQRLDEFEQTFKDEAARLADGVESVAKQKVTQASQFASKQIAVLEKRVGERVTTFVDRLLYGKPPVQKKLLPDGVAEYVLKALRILVILSCIGNLWGPEPVPNLWAASAAAVGAEGAEGAGVDVLVERRTLAGALDLAGFLLLIPKASHKTQMYGAALIALIFGRGCLLNYYDSSSSGGAVDMIWEMLFSGIVAALASTLLVNEFVTILEKQESKKHKRKMLIPGAVATLVVTIIISEVLSSSGSDEKQEKGKR